MFDRLIVGSMIPIWPLLDSSERQQVTVDATSYVTKAVSGAPLHIRLGVKLVSALIGWMAWLTCLGAGGPLVRAWRFDALCEVFKRLPGPAWPVVRLYRSMTLLAFYDHPLVAAKLAAGVPARHAGAAR